MNCELCGKPDYVESSVDLTGMVLCWYCLDRMEVDEYPDEPDPNVSCSRCGCAQHPDEIMDLDGAPACESCVEAFAGPFSGAWVNVPF